MNGTPVIQSVEDQASGHRAPQHLASGEVKFALPSGLLFAAMIVTVMLAAGSWAGAVALFGLDRSTFVSGMVGIGVVGVMTILGVVVMTPWKSRAVADWMTMWLAGTVFRVLLTPVVAYVLYSALSSDREGGLIAKPLALSVAITYMIALFVEAAVLSKYLKRFCPPLSPPPPPQHPPRLAPHIARRS